MDIIEKLIELLDSMMVYDECLSNEEIADLLITNGVTIQKWYSASTTPKDGLYIVKLSNEHKLPARYNCGKWIACEGYRDITSQVISWMEIPE